jgi:hypothetical protein
MVHPYSLLVDVGNFVFCSSWIFLSKDNTPPWLWH